MKKLLFLLVIALTTLSACRRNQLKKPTDVSFRMDINRAQSQQGHLIFNSGFIIINDFSIEGTRKEGDPISFSRSFTNGLNINFNSNNTVEALDFDIPQGDYTEIEIELTTRYNNGNPNVEVKGTYTNTMGTSYPLIYQFKDDDNIALEAEAEGGASSIILDSKVPTSSLMLLDPVFWFATVSNNLFDSASLVNVDGVPTILVNSNTNEDIYDIVVDRMGENSKSIW